MIDLGEKIPKGESVAPSEGKGKKIYYPSLYISNKDLGLDEKDVGNRKTAIIEVEVKEVSKRINAEKKTDSAILDVINIEFIKKRTSHYKR